MAKNYASVFISKNLHKLLLEEKEETGVPIGKIVEKLILTNIYPKRKRDEKILHQEA